MNTSYSPSFPTPDNAALIPLKEPRAIAGLAVKPPAVFLPSEKAGERFFGFFTAHIRNKNTQRAYYKTACRFSDWCQGRGLLDLAQVKPPHVAAYIEMLGVPEPDGAGPIFAEERQDASARTRGSTGAQSASSVFFSPGFHPR